MPEIAGELRVSEGTVRLWLERFNQAGIDGLADRPRSGKRPTYGAGSRAGAPSATAPPVAGAHGGHDQKADATSVGAASYDRRFITAMAPHHESAIEMATMALERAKHPELERLAREIVEGQHAENGRMAAWYREWYGGEISAGTDHSMPGMDGGGAMGVSAEELRRAEPFDRAFIDAMILHHEAAVEMARDARTRAEHPELRGLAADIASAQEREIARMERWRAAWYGANATPAATIGGR